MKEDLSENVVKGFSNHLLKGGAGSGNFGHPGYSRGISGKIQQWASQNLWKPGGSEDHAMNARSASEHEKASEFHAGEAEKEMKQGNTNLAGQHFLASAHHSQAASAIKNNQQSSVISKQARADSTELFGDLPQL